MVAKPGQWAPHQISEAFHVVLLHGQLKLFQVEPQILNPVAVIHGPIFLKCIHCAQAILSHNQGLPVFAVHCVQEIAKAFRSMAQPHLLCFR